MQDGDKVVCMVANGTAGRLRKGQIYTISGSAMPGHVYLDGVERLYPGFWTHRFRRLDISSLTALLNVRERVPA